MKNLINTIRQNPYFFIGYLFFFIILTAFCLLTNKASAFLWINSFHTVFLDDFFVVFTNIGNGLFVIAAVAWMLIRKKNGWAWQTGISFLASGLIVQVFKHLIFSPRPRAYFESKASIHLIQGITCTGSSSFPSGHTASAFALATLLALFVANKSWSILFLSLALLTGFSRIYLSQHFPLDVLIGSLIGVMVSIFIYSMFPFRFSANKSHGSSWNAQSIKLH